MGKISQFVKAGALILSMAGCSSPNSGGKDAEMDRFISDLMGRMTLQEKLGQLNLPAGNDLVSGAVKNSKMAEAIRAGAAFCFDNSWVSSVSFCCSSLFSVSSARIRSDAC